jgi:hypothetical protein
VHCFKLCSVKTFKFRAVVFKLRLLSNDRHHSGWHPHWQIHPAISALNLGPVTISQGMTLLYAIMTDSDASAPKRPRAFRIIEHYIGPSAGPKFKQIQADLIQVLLCPSMMGGD